jgi:8-oxo-dGTP pyrophosphatase MutT (NUDIX family)
MPIPPHVAELRAHIGHALLWLATARTVTIDDHGHVLLGRYQGNHTWTIPGGVIDPGEQPADAAVRECYEETGIIAVPDALTSVTVSGLVIHDNGDLTQHLDITFRCRATGGDPKPGDGEFQDARWHRADELPAMPAYEHGIVIQALRGDNQAAYTFPDALTLKATAAATASFVRPCYRLPAPAGSVEQRGATSMFERFTDRARRVVVLAQEEARMLNHNYIGTEHILLGLIHEGEGV